MASSPATGVNGADPDAVPPPSERPVSMPGDLWVCGTYRIICDDSTNADHVGALLAGGKPHLIVTDPPVGSTTTPPGGH